MVKILYLDEQTAKIRGEEFTAVTGVLIDSAEIEGFRHSVYDALSLELELIKVSGDGKTKTISEFPILHGVEFLAGKSDDTKIKCLNILLNCICATSAQFVRVGYFHKSIFQIADQQPKQIAVTIAMLSIWMSMEIVKGDFLLASEIDKEELKRHLTSQADSLWLYYISGTLNISVPFERMLGHFFALKKDLGCQFADLISYICLKNTVAETGFARNMGDAFEMIRDRFILNEIIFANDPTKSVKYEQAYDQPLRSWFPIVPSD